MKRVAIFVILAALTVGFSSCSAVRHCQAPEVEMPGQIASGYTDSLTIADLSWWQFYGDSTLRRVIELTLENNKDMLAAAARVEQMRQLYRISKAERLPNFSAKGLADYETNDYADEESSRDPEFSAKLSVSWELDLWGNLRWAKRKGGAEYLSSVEDWRAMRMTLVAEVATAYFQLMALDNELSIVRRTLRTRSEGVQQAQLRFEGGLTSETVYQQAKVEYASTATLIPDTLMHYAEQRPEFTGLASSMQADIPQLYFDVDRDKAQLVGVSMSDIFSTMKAFTGSIYVNDFNMFNRIYRVYIQADAPYRAYRDNLNLFFVRGADGAMIPVTSLGTTHYTTGAGTIKRFNMFNAATITGEAAHGYSSGQAMDELENIVREKLPASVGVEWSGLSYQEKHVSGQTGLVLALAFLFVFLFLAAQYESWSVPVAVILSLPVAGIGAYLGIWVCGLENNIYFQIGLVMLVGLVAKNAILIVEFAKEEVEKGRDVVSAALKAAHLRFRPIVMTSLAFILGLLPLVFASGPGSASRQGIGTGVFFGMLVAISVGIVFVPFFFVWIYRIKAKLKKR